MKTIAALETITHFINGIGIPCIANSVREDSFLSGVDIQKGQILYDEKKLISCGDLLHEAGHIAVLKPEHRVSVCSPDVSGDLDEGGAEMAAIAWSWAALKYLKIVPEIVFHKEGYKGDADSIIENFSNHRYFGVSMLSWFGMTVDPTNVDDINKKECNVFPEMSNWLR